MQVSCKTYCSSKKGWMSSNELDMYCLGHLSDQSTRKANSMPFHSIAKRQAITRGPSMRLGQAATWEDSTTVPGKSVMNWNNCSTPISGNLHILFAKSSHSFSLIAKVRHTILSIFGLRNKRNTWWTQTTKKWQKWQLSRTIYVKISWFCHPSSS